MTSQVRTILDRVVVGVGLLLLWQVAHMAAGTYWLSSPWQTLQRLAELAASGELARHAAYTLRAAGYGFVLGGVPGLLLPFLLRRLPIVSATLMPFMVAGYGLPKLALAPLFILWFGIGIESKVAVVAAATFFLVFFNVEAGVRALDLKLVQMAQILGASEMQVARHVILPGAVPFVFAGIRTATPYAIGAAVIAELISSNRGLGYLVQLGASNFDAKTMIAAVVATTVIVVGANSVVNALERWLLRWRPRSGFAAGAASGEF